MSGIMTGLSGLRTQLANCTALRTWMGVSTTAAALARIHYFGCTDAQMDGDPLVVIAPGSAWSREQVTIDQAYFTSPVIAVQFVEVVDKDDSDETVFGTLTATIDSIMAQLETNTTWPIASWSPDGETSPARANASASEDVASFTLIITGNLDT